MESGSVPGVQVLLTRLAAGDRSALHPAFEALWPLVRGFTARHLPAAEADDAAQETLMKVFRQAASFDPERSALAWVFGIAGWEVRTACRRLGRRREVPESVAAPQRRADSAADPEEALLDRDLAATLERALGGLRPEDAATLRLYAEGRRPAIAAATFRKRLSRALARLRLAWRTTDEHP
jgi:RNA polymerase sigma-70 factor (ECF subfamily)